MRFWCSALISVLALLTACSDTPRNACALPPAIEAEIEGLLAMDGSSLSQSELAAPRHALAERYPETLLVQWRLQEDLRHAPWATEEWDWALAHYRSMEDRAAGDLLEARLFLRLYKSAGETLARLVAEAPELPWAHLAMVEWAAAQIEVDSGLIARHVREFRRRCPGSLEVFAHAADIADEALAQDMVEDAVRLLAGRTDDRALAAWPAVWNVMLRLRPEEASGEAPASIRAKLDELQELGLLDNRQWISTMRAGYRILGENERSEALDDHLLAERPESVEAYRITRSRWQNERRTQVRSRADHEKMREAEFRMAKQWREQWPGIAEARHYAFLIARQLDLPPAEFLPIVDDNMEGRERRPYDGVSWPTLPLQIADHYVRHNVRLDRVPGLVLQGLSEFERVEKYRRKADAEPFAANRGPRFGTMTDDNALRLMAEYYRLTGQMEKFETLAAHARKQLEEKPGPMAKPAEISGYNNRYFQFLRLAKNAGLSTEGLSPAPQVEAAERAAVADFEAEDLDGKLWRSADWRGKVVLIHVWAGWSSLSKEEHDDLQTLHQQLAGDSDRMLVSIAADGDAGEIRDYMKANGYTFPVLLGRAAAESVFPPVSFPRNWLLDAQGRRLTHNVSFAGEGGRAWLLLLMDQVQARDTLASLAPGREHAPPP